MSPVLSSQQSLDTPSGYTVFERDVFRASSPQSEKRPRNHSRKLDKAKKFKRFSKVAFAGESPNLEDVSSGILSKGKKSVLVLSVETRDVQPSTSTSPVLFDSHSGSSTPSLHVENRNVPDVQCGSTVPDRPICATSSPPKRTLPSTLDLLTTESIIESSAVINGQSNVLRIESSPDAVLPVVGKLPCNQQIELSVRKAREWLNSIPDNGEPIPDVGNHENSLVSSVSRISDAPADCTQGSVLVVAPDPTVREVRILLQRLDPQILLRVPIRDIQNLIRTPSNLSLPQVQRTMNNLLVSNKMGLTAVDNRLMKSIQSNNVSKKTGDVSNKRQSRKAPPKEKKNKVGKRKLFTAKRQHSNLSQELNLTPDNVSVRCPYTPPTKKRGRLIKKPSVPVRKKLQSGQQSTKDKRKSPRLPKQKKPQEKKMPETNQPTVVSRTRSSDMLKAQTAEPVQSKAISRGYPEKIPSTSNVQRKSHDMALRRKSNSRRTSLFFQPKSQASKPKRAVKRNSACSKHGPRVVCTFLHRGEVDRVASVIKRLGGVMESKVSAATTHVVCGGPKRTVNLLRGIARGCWLVTFEWVLQSVEKREWVDEEPFEVTNFSPAVQKCRIARETLGIFPKFFEKAGTIFVAPKTAPPKSELWELLKLCGAKVVTTSRRATVAVGTKIPGVTSVREVWILDSIQENMLLPFQQYLLEDEQNE